MTPFLRPLMRAWARSSAAAAPPRPLPAGDPVVVVAGADPDRVLVVGSGPAAGGGAADHSSALPGALARALALRTGRGAVVEARGAHRAAARDLAGLVRGAELRRFDALVVYVGLEDGVAGVPLRRWRGTMGDFVGELRRAGARDATVVLTRIPPASSVEVYRGPMAVLADLRIRRLNRAIGALAQEHAGVITGPAPLPRPDARVGTPAWYERCGSELADLLHGRFAEQGD